MALTDDLISSWELDEASGNRADSHGSNTLTDNNTVGSGTGHVNGTAADFEVDNSEYLNCADNASLSTGDIDFTFEAWVKAESFAGGGAGNHIVTKDTNTGREYALLLLNGVPRFHIVGTSAGFVDWGSSLSTGTWYQVIAWHDSVNDELGIVVNAGTAVTAATSGAPSDTGTEFRIGASAYPGFTDPFDGLIGPVRFWKRLLSGAERTELYNSGDGLTYAELGGGGGTFTGALAATAGAATFSGSAEFDAPVYDGTLAATAGAATFSGSATHETPIYDGTLAATAGAAAFAGSAEFDAPVYTGQLAATAGAASFAGGATFDAPVHEGTLTVTAGASVFSGSATFDESVSLGTLTLTNGAASFAGTATFVAATFDPPIVNLTGTLTRSASLTGTRTRNVSITGRSPR